MAKEKSTTKPAKKPDKETGKKPAEVPTQKAQKTQKSKKGWVIGAIVAAALALIGVVVALFCLNQPDPSDPTAKLTYSPAFFIYNDDEYTLWNADGKRVTEEEYNNAYDFVGGYAMVRKDDQYGIIREDGKMTVEFGKYGNISVKGGLYLAQDGNTKEYFLLTGDGKELAKGAELEVFAPSSTCGFAAAVADGKVKLFNYTGKLIAETDVVEGAEDPAMNSLRDFGIFHYDKQNVVFDARNGEVLAEFEGARYSFDTITDDRKMILLKDYDDSDKYKLIANGKVYDLDETKYYGIVEPNMLIGYDDFKELALLDNDYKVAKRVNTYIDVKDTNNYAVKTDDGVEIYRNGEMVKKFGEDSSIASSGVLYEDLYAIGEGDKYMFYNLDGEVAINHEFKDIRSLFNKFHHAVVADEDDEYYLIDVKGNKLGESTYKNILRKDGGYELKNADGKYAIADKSGKPVTDFKYTSTYYRNNAEPRNIWTGRVDDDSFDVINVETGEVILADVDVDGFYDNYFTAKNSDGGRDYYTYSGEKFYTAEK